MKAMIDRGQVPWYRLLIHTPLWDMIKMIKNSMVALLVVNRQGSDFPFKRKFKKSFDFFQKDIFIAEPKQSLNNIILVVQTMFTLIMDIKHIGQQWVNFMVVALCFGSNHQKAMSIANGDLMNTTQLRNEPN